MTVRHFPEPQRSGARLMYIIESTGSSLRTETTETKARKIRVAVPFTAKRFSSTWSYADRPNMPRDRGGREFGVFQQVQRR